MWIRSLISRGLRIFPSRVTILRRALRLAAHRSLVFGLWGTLLGSLRDHALNRPEILDSPGRLTGRALGLGVAEPRQEQVEVVLLL